MVQAFSGMFSVNGAQDGPPARVGMQVLDLGTGVWAALGCLAALYRRQATGVGGTVDTSLFETALGWLQVMMAGYNATGKQPERHRSGNPNVVVFQALPTLDGEVIVAAANDRLFAKLARAVGRPDWVTDPRYASNALRVSNKSFLLPDLEAIFKKQPSQHWIEALEEAGVPCAPIQDFQQVIADPQTAAIDIFQTLPEVELNVVGLPVSFDGERPPLKARAPTLGEHNAEILPHVKIT
jgi:crotonobetainyl-CoA:carnitine CoA-transferase CaiB-like acyl-CoA transferase